LDEIRVKHPLVSVSNDVKAVRSTEQAANADGGLFCSEHINEGIVAVTIGEGNNMQRRVDG